MATAGHWNTLKTPLRESTLDVLQELNFSQMTPVQAASIPLFLTNKDVAVEVCSVCFIMFRQRQDLVKLLPLRFR